MIDLFGIKRRRLSRGLEKASNEALMGVICSFFPNTPERKEYEVTMQKIFDDNYEKEIELESQELFSNWINPSHVSYFYWCSNIKLMLYELYDEDTSKYLKSNVSKLVLDRFEEIKKESGIEFNHSLKKFIIKTNTIK